MTSHGKNFILLIKKTGKRKDKNGSLTLLGRSKVKTDVLPGTLLHHIDNKTKGSTFYLVFTSLEFEPVEVDCIPGEAEPIPSESGILELLQPIPTCSERLAVYSDKNWLKEGRRLNVNDSVFVKSKFDSSELPGIIKYKGTVSDVKGTYFGVELIDHPGQGNSDGKFRNVEYFKCAQNDAVFCALHKIRRRKESFVCSDLLKAEGSQYKSKNATNSKFPDCNLDIGDRIVWMKDSGSELGTVKWIGILPDSKNNDITVGVEFDEPVGSGTGKYSDHRLFYAKQNYASLIPLMGLMKAEELCQTGTPEGIDADSGMYPESCGYNKDRLAEEPLDRGQIKYTFNNDYRNLAKEEIVKKEKSDSFEISSEQLPSLPPKQHPVNNNNCTYKARGFIETVKEPVKLQNEKYEPTNKQDFDDNDHVYDKHIYSKGLNPVYEFHRQEDEENHNLKSHARPVNDLCVGWRVTVPLKQHVSSIYGVIRWIGDFDGKETVGIETDEEINAGTDGTFKGKRLFNCAPKHGFFVPLDKCRKDKRFYSSIRTSLTNGFGSLETPDINGDVSPPTSLDLAVDNICGKKRGIQGHHNSCYLDSMLFGMFYFTTVFDTILYRPRTESDIEPYETVQKVLKEGIVNPLRKNHYVRADKVMKLRELLDKHSSIPGMMNEEKDPEEFLVALLADVMKADPFLHLSSGEHTYFYQLFMERDDHLLLPTTQRLVEISCLQGNVKLKEVPSCLIIQMPRFGKDYKMYRRIIPSLELDITDILENNPRECIICGRLAEYECKECYKVTGSPGLISTAFCNSCKIRNHNHPSRKGHIVAKISVPDQYLDFISEYSKSSTPEDPEYRVTREKMELFAVICIQTSHYVSFVKCGSGRDAQWVFFDSMADRMGEQSGYNIPQVTPVPDLKNWLSENKFEELATANDDKLFPEHMRRLLGDAYMCMYQSPDVMRFR